MTYQTEAQASHWLWDAGHPSLLTIVEGLRRQTTVHEDLGEEQGDALSIWVSVVRDVFGTRPRLPMDTSHMIKRLSRVQRDCQDECVDYRTFIEAQAYWYRERRAREGLGHEGFGPALLDQPDALSNYNAYIRRAHRRYRNTKGTPLATDARTLKIRAALQAAERSIGAYITGVVRQGQKCSMRAAITAIGQDLSPIWLRTQTDHNPSGVDWTPAVRAHEMRVARWQAYAYVVDRYDYRLSSLIHAAETTTWCHIAAFIAHHYPLTRRATNVPGSWHSKVAHHV